MDFVLQQRLLSTLTVLALVLTVVAIWRSLRRSRTILIISAWCAGGFAVGTWFVTSLNGRATGNIASVLALIGMIAGSVGQLARHYKDRIAPASLLPAVKRSGRGVATDDRRAQANRIRSRNRRTPSSWDWVAGPWGDGVINRRLALIVFTIGATLAAILIIRYPWGTAPARQAPMYSETPEIAKLPTVKETWTYQTGVPWQSSADSWRTPAIGSDGTVYALGEHQVLALSASGELKWRYPDSGLPRFGSMLSVLIADDGAVWGGAQTGWVIRINNAGEAQPQFGGPGVINQLALSSTGVVLVCGGNMSSTIATTGYPKETRDIAGSISPNLGPLKSAAFGPDGVVTIADDTLTSWPSDFRQANWRKKVGWGCHRPAIAKDGTIYVACDDEMAAINPDGSSKWSFPIKFPTPAVIAEDGTVFFAGIIEGKVYSVDPDGHVRWTFSAGKPVGSTPAISRSGVIYVGSHDGHVFALDAVGAPLWALRTNGEVGSPTIGSDGTVYVQSGDGILHAIAQPQNGGLAGQWPKLDANESNTARSQ